MISREWALAIIDVRDMLVELAFRRDQPRWPKGSGRGGQWRGDGIPGGFGGFPDPDMGDIMWRYRAGEGTPLSEQGSTSTVTEITDANGDRWIVKDYLGDHESDMLPDEVDNEVLTTKVAELIGAPVVPVHKVDDATIIMPKLNGRTGLAHDVEETGDEYDHGPTMRAAIDSPEGGKLALLDLVTENGDRHSGNVIIGEDGKPIGIDQGRTFWGGGSDSVFDFDFSNPPLSREEVLDARTKVEAEKDGIFKDHPYEYKSMMNYFDMADDPDNWVPQEAPEFVAPDLTPAEEHELSIRQQLNDIINKPDLGPDDLPKMIALQKKLTEAVAKSRESRQR